LHICIHGIFQCDNYRINNNSTFICGNLCCPSVTSASKVVVSSSMFGKVHTRSLLILQMTCIGSSGFVTELVVYVKSGRFINDLVVYVKGQPSGSS